MPRVLAIDLGKRAGYAVMGGPRVLSGSHEIVKRWAPLGASLLTLEDRLYTLILAHKPDVVACATPFVRRGRGGAMIDTPVNLVPMFCCFGVLHMLCDAMGIRLETIEESRARKVMLGDFLPRKSAAVKEAIMRACRSQGWPVTNDHAGDALCIAAAITERLDPAKSYEMTPLFQAAPTMRSRRKPRK